MDIMLFKDLTNKLVQKESIRDMNIFFEDYETFEEIPVASRLSYLSFLEKYIEPQDNQLFLLSFAYFYLNSIKCCAKKRLSATQLDQFYICLTFGSLDWLESEGFCIPNFFVTRKLGYFEYLKQPSDVKVLDEYPILKSAFVQTGLIYCFDFFKTSFVDSFGDKIERVYARLK